MLTCIQSAVDSCPSNFKIKQPMNIDGYLDDNRYIILISTHIRIGNQHKKAPVTVHTIADSVSDLSLVTRNLLTQTKANTIISRVSLRQGFIQRLKKGREGGERNCVWHSLQLSVSIEHSILGRRGWWHAFPKIIIRSEVLLRF